MEDGLSHRLTQSECNRNQTNTKKYRKIRSFTSETITSCSPFAFFRIPKYNMWRVTLRNYDIPFFPTTSHYPWISYSRDSFYHAGDHSIGRIISGEYYARMRSGYILPDANSIFTVRFSLVTLVGAASSSTRGLFN